MSVNVEYSLELNNVVSSGSLTKEIEIEEVREALSDYDGINVPPKEPGLHIKMDEIEGTFIVHSSGEYFLTGCSDEESVDKSMNRIKEVLADIGIITEEERDAITNDVNNVICTGNIENFNTIDLRRLSIHLGLEDIVYNGEEFSSVVFSDEKYLSTFQVFSSAKVVLTGAPSFEKSKEEFELFIDEKLVPFFEITERH